jgi:hypothetical protein
MEPESSLQCSQEPTTAGSSESNRSWRRRDIGRCIFALWTDYGLKTSIYIINNSLQFFIIYVPNQQLQGQLQTDHSVATGNYIKDKQNIKTTATYNNSNLSLRGEKLNMYIYSGYAIMRRKRIHTVHTYMLRVISVLIHVWCKDHYKIWLRRTFLALNTSSFLPTTLATDARQTEGQLLFEKTLNKAKSLMYREHIFGGKCQDFLEILLRNETGMG